MKILITAALLAVAAPLAAQTAGGKAQNPSDAFMGRFDANQDGKVTLEEFKTPQIKMLEQQFTFMDKNTDGSVDNVEIDAFAKEMQQRMEQMRQQGGGSKPQ